MPSALRDFDSLPNSAFVRQPIVQALFASSAATIWRRVHDGRLPQPRKLSSRITAWNVGELRRVLLAPEEHQVTIRASQDIRRIAPPSK